MPVKARDSQRQKLYNAQYVIPGYAVENQFGTVEQCQKWLDEEVLNTRWFRSRWQLPGGVPIRSGVGIGTSYRRHITLGLKGRNPGVILHELAHQLVSRAVADGDGRAAHGPEFAAIFLFLVRQVMGKDVADKLHDSFVAHKVKHRAPGAVPAPHFRVPTQAQERVRRVAAATRPVLGSERRVAADVIRRAVRAGEFGKAGSKTRTGALAVARTIEKELA